MQYILQFLNVPVIPSPIIIGVFGMDLIILGEITIVESF